jgi:hypothetical protein
MASSSSKTMKDLNSQASILEARIAQMQMENEAKLARQKAVFETKLKSQEMGNRQVVNQNQLISAQIAVLKEQNANLTTQAHRLVDENKLGRVELQTIQAKLKVATTFIDESLKATSDRDAKALDVLLVTSSANAEQKKDANVEKKEDDQQQDDQAGDVEEEEDVVEEDATDAGDADSEDEDAAPATSFLGLRSKVQRMKVKESAGQELQAGAMSEIEQEMFSKPEVLAANPRDLLKVLSSQVDDLSQDQQSNAAKMKSMFLSAFKVGTKRHNALLKEQKALNATRTGLATKQQKLQSAVAHLETTHEHLQERLRGLGLFVQRLGHLAIAPSSEAKHLVKSLPNKVTPAKSAFNH